MATLIVVVEGEKFYVAQDPVLFAMPLVHVAGPFETRDAAYAAKELMESTYDHREP